MIKSIYFIVILLGSIYGQTFQIARIQYSGGGDWYCDPSSLPNLLNYLENNTPISLIKKRQKLNFLMMMQLNIHIYILLDMGI